MKTMKMMNNIPIIPSLTIFFKDEFNNLIQLIKQNHLNYITNSENMILKKINFNIIKITYRYK